MTARLADEENDWPAANFYIKSDVVVLTDGNDDIALQKFLLKAELVKHQPQVPETPSPST